MRSRNSRRRQTRRLFLGVLFTGGLVIVTVMTAFSQGWFGGSAPGTSANLSSHVSGPSQTDATSSEAATPTPVIVADATPPPPANPDDLKMSWETPAVFDGANAFPEQKMTMTGLDGASINYWIFKLGLPLNGYTTDTPISFGGPEDYTSIDGVLAFRGNNYRTAPAWGTADVSQKKLQIVWTKDIGAVT